MGWSMRHAIPPNFYLFAVLVYWMTKPFQRHTGVGILCMQAWRAGVLHLALFGGSRFTNAKICSWRLNILPIGMFHSVLNQNANGSLIFPRPYYLIVTYEGLVRLQSAWASSWDRNKLVMPCILKSCESQITGVTIVVDGCNGGKDI